ncbi:MAG: cytochrome c3 family protein [Gallionella sp.]
MKQQLLNQIAVCATVVLVMFAMSLPAIAAPTDSKGFNHAHTGYQLTGAHAVAACETCHTGGVFEGTPQKCDECHEVGRRVVATPKSAAHIVTTANCETCHFSTITFLGAKFNHGMATPGGCESCHNGRIKDGRPSSHSSGSKLTSSCDSCHRSSGWLPATWNHGPETIGSCKNCHENSSLVSSQNLKPAGHTTIAKSTYQCDECHTVFGWQPAKYKHNTPGVCSSCHNASIAIGKPSDHTSISKATFACDDCHSISGWQPAKYKHINAAGLCSSCHNHTIAEGKPADHTPASIRGTNECDDCHKRQGWSPAAFTHNIGGQLCSSCHNNVKAIGAPGNHLGFPGWPIECDQCHLNTLSFSGALGAKPSNHIPYNPGVTCSDCHIGAGSIARGSAMHMHVNTFNCFTCHGSNTMFSGNGQTIEPWPNFHEMDKNPAAMDCSDSGCHRPRGIEGTAYRNWD